LAACGGSEQNAPVATPEASLPPKTIIQEDPRAGLAAEVNGVAIPISDLDKRLAFFSSGTNTQAANQDDLINYVLETLISDQLVQQSAEAMGIVISDEQIQAEIAEMEALAIAQNSTLEAFLAQNNIAPEDYPQQVRLTLLTEQLNAQITADLPTSGPQVRARHILVADEATAQDILTRLENGEDFTALAEQYSLDPSNREAGGDLGWISPGDLLQPEVENMIFSLPSNSRAPAPVRSILGYHIIETIAREENRPLDAQHLAELRQTAWEEWLNQQRAAAVIMRYVGPNAQ
jgi:parvulin-like peptidyl-prolyl isomerase